MARGHDRSGGGHLLEPKVTVEVLTYRPVYVLGESTSRASLTTSSA